MNGNNFQTQTGGNLQTGNPQQIAGSGLQQPENNLQTVGGSLQLFGGNQSQLRVETSSSNAVLASSTAAVNQPPPISDNRNLLPFVGLALLALFMSVAMMLAMFKQSGYRPKK